MYYIGIDLGGTKIAAGVTDECGKLYYKCSTRTNTKLGPAQIIKDMVDISVNAAKGARIDMSDISSIGIGVPGTPDNNNGVVVYACNIGFRNIPLREEIQKYISKPVYIENDANCAALAESACGAAKNSRSSVTVTIGTGIGGGIIISNRLFSGFNFGASELGHMVINSQGELCSCGRRGCWETYASASALVRQTNKILPRADKTKILEIAGGDPDKVNAKTVFDAANQGDKTAKEIIEQYIWYLSEGITNIINMLQPELIVIGGGVGNAGESLLKPLRECVYKYIYTREEVPRTKIVPAMLGNDAGIIGAALLGVDAAK